MNTTKKTIQLFFILALMSGGLWNLNSCKDDNSEILEKIDQFDKSLSDKIDKLSEKMIGIIESLKTLTTEVKVHVLATEKDVAAVKSVVDKLTTELGKVASTVSGLKNAISDDVKVQLETQLGAIKGAITALQTALKQKIVASDASTQTQYEDLLSKLATLQAKLDTVKTDLEGADGIIEKLKALQEALTTGTGGIKEQLTTLKTTVDGLVTSLDALSKESAKQEDLKAIKTLVENIIETLKTLATKADTPTKKEIQEMEARLQEVLVDFEQAQQAQQAQTETEKEHYDEIMKTLKAQNTYVINDGAFADYLRADSNINKAFIFTDKDIEDSVLLEAEGLKKEDAKRYINKEHIDFISYKTLDISSYGRKAKIKSLKAIEIFTALEKLNANGLTNLDKLNISPANDKLTELYVSGDKKLNVENDLSLANCTLLTILDASGTNIPNLSLRSNRALVNLNLHNCTELGSLDASNNNVLASLNVLGCSSLGTLDVSKTKLKNLDISGRTFSNLKIVTAKSCSKLTTLSANRPNTSSGSIVTLDASSDVALITLTANNNSGFETLTLNDDSALKTLEADFASFSSGLPTLEKLGAENALETLKVSNTNLTKLDVSQNHNLVTLIAENSSNTHNGKIASIVLPGGVSFHSSSKELLNTLDVSGNKLTFINLANLESLRDLDVSYNLLSGNTPKENTEAVALISANNGLDTHVNKYLERLNVSHNKELLSLKLWNNGLLKYLNIMSTKIATDVKNKLDVSMIKHFKTSSGHAGAGLLDKDDNQSEIQWNK